MSRSSFAQSQIQLLRNHSHFCSHRKAHCCVWGRSRWRRFLHVDSRVANHANGDAARYCQLLGLFENGIECYDNLRDTIISTMVPIRSFLQLLLDDKLVALILTVETDDGVRHCICVLVQRLDLERGAEFIPNDVKFTLSSEDIAADVDIVIPDLSRAPHPSASCRWRFRTKPCASSRLLVTTRDRM